MDNKIKHYSASQAIPEMEFKPLLRGESPYYGNLNRPSQSAYDLANTVAEVQSWGGLISILQPLDQSHEYKLYEIAQILDGEILAPAVNGGPAGDRYGIVVAEAEVDTVSGLMKNIAVCTFCPNFVYPTITPVWSVGTNGDLLVLDVNSDSTYLDFANTTGTIITNPALSDMSKAPIAIRTGTKSIFFAGTARIFGLGYQVGA